MTAVVTNAGETDREIFRNRHGRITSHFSESAHAESGVWPGRMLYSAFRIAVVVFALAQPAIGFSTAAPVRHVRRASPTQVLLSDSAVIEDCGCAELPGGVVMNNIAVNGAKLRSTGVRYSGVPEIKYTPSQPMNNIAVNGAKLRSTGVRYSGVPEIKYTPSQPTCLMLVTRFLLLSVSSCRCHWSTCAGA
jgi:hypothetical protein